MAFNFDSFKERAKELAQTGVAKAKELTDAAVDKGKEVGEIGKLKVQNATEQDAIRKAYIELGKLYYAERGSAPEPAYAALCQQISDSNARIAYNNERIEDIKAAGKLADEDIVDCECTCQGECECPAEEAPAEECPCCCEGEPAPEQDHCCCGDEPQA